MQMTLSDPVCPKTFCDADSLLPEYMCQVYLMGLTPARARQLRRIHRFHPPDECVVHLQTATMLLTDESG